MTLQLSEAWIALLAALVPFLTAAATKPATSNSVRAVMAIVAAAALTVVNSIVNGESSVASLAGAFITAMVVSLTSYLGIAKHLKVNERVLPNVGL